MIFYLPSFVLPKDSIFKSKGLVAGFTVGVFFVICPLVVSSLAWFRLFPFVCLLGVENYWVVVDLNSAVIRNFGFLEFQFLFFEKWVEWF